MKRSPFPLDNPPNESDDKALRWLIRICVGTLVLAFVAGLVALAVRIPRSGGGGLGGSLSASIFNSPGLHELAPGKYRLVIVARQWAFDPARVHVPEGATVEIVGTSADVVHGLRIPKADVSLQLLPGGIARKVHTFATPGEYRFFCDVFCGPGHANMVGAIVVDPAPGAPSSGSDAASARSP